MVRLLVAALLAFVLPASASPASSPRAAAPASGVAQPLEYGVAWYPEQWPEAGWDADLTLMRAGRASRSRRLPMQ